MNWKDIKSVWRKLFTERKREQERRQSERERERERVNTSRREIQKRKLGKRNGEWEGKKKRK